jgi:D-alanyl-D-alanine carboxypeptidase
MNRKAVIIVAALILITLLGYLGFAGMHAPATTPTLPQSSTPQTNQTHQLSKQKYSTVDPASIWVVVNKKRPFNPKDYAPNDLVKPAVSTSGAQSMRAEAANAAVTMFAAAKKEGIMLRVDSAYRSYTKQVAVYNNEVKTNGQKVADTQSARPGYSEHQTGLVADFGAASGKCSIADCFANMSEGKWMAANAFKYGFIMRYPPTKQSITGYRYEPWHFRYVGTELSQDMHAQNIETLEEYFNLGAAPDYN